MAFQHNQHLYKQLTHLQNLYQKNHPSLTYLHQRMYGPRKFICQFEEYLPILTIFVDWNMFPDLKKKWFQVVHDHLMIMTLHDHINLSELFII